MSLDSDQSRGKILKLLMNKSHYNVVEYNKSIKIFLPKKQIFEYLYFIYLNCCCIKQRETSEKVLAKNINIFLKICQTNGLAIK